MKHFKQRFCFGIRSSKSISPVGSLLNNIFIHSSTISLICLFSGELSIASLTAKNGFTIVDISESERCIRSRFLDEVALFAGPLLLLRVPLDTHGLWLPVLLRFHFRCDVLRIEEVGKGLQE